MLSWIRAGGYKGLSSDLELAPITVLCGPNGVGKSSLIQVPLLLQQAYSTAGAEESINLNGDLVRPGTFRAISPDRGKNFFVCVGAGFDEETGGAAGADQEGLDRPVRQILLDNGLKPGRRPLSFRSHFSLEEDESSDATGSSAVVQMHEVEVRRGKRLVFRLRLGEEGTFSRHGGLFEAPGLRALVQYDGRDESLRWQFRGLEPQSELFRGDSPFHWDGDHTHPDDVAWAQALRLYFAVAALTKERLVRDITYLGALRAEPQHSYPDHAARSAADPRGERAAQFFVRGHSRSCRRIPADVAAEHPEAEETTLGAAADEWFHHMGLGKVTPLGLPEAVGWTVQADDSPFEATPRETGVGVSQVFPIVVHGLGLESGQTLLIEQPEAHLHPKLQTDLADFFVALGRAGRQVVVETHSEHVVNRLVRRAVEGLVPPEMIRIYFASQTHGRTQFELVRIDPVFGITNWPKGFFDQYVDEAEAIIRASLRHRARADSN
jgi:predicted ATPase